MIPGGRRRATIRVRVNRELLQRKLDKLAADLGGVIDPHAIDAQYVAQLRKLAEAKAPRQTGELR